MLTGRAAVSWYLSAQKSALSARAQAWPARAGKAARQQGIDATAFEATVAKRSPQVAMPYRLAPAGGSGMAGGRTWRRQREHGRGRRRIDRLRSGKARGRHLPLPPAAPPKAPAAIGGALARPANDAGSPQAAPGARACSECLHACITNRNGMPVAHRPTSIRYRRPLPPPGGVHGGGSAPCPRARPRPLPAPPAGQFKRSAILMLFSFRSRSALINSSCSIPSAADARIRSTTQPPPPSV